MLLPPCAQNANTKPHSRGRIHRIGQTEEHKVWILFLDQPQLRKTAQRRARGALRGSWATLDHRRRLLYLDFYRTPPLRDEIAPDSIKQEATRRRKGWAWEKAIKSRCRCSSSTWNLQRRNRRNLPVVIHWLNEVEDRTPSIITADSRTALKMERCE